MGSLLVAVAAELVVVVVKVLEKVEVEKLAVAPPVEQPVVASLVELPAAALVVPEEVDRQVRE